MFCRKMYRKGFDPGCFQAPKYAINHAKELLCSKNPIAVISPRYTKFEASRNTKVEYIDKMIEKAIKAGFDVCYIHDQEDTGVIHEKITRRKELKMIPEASFNLPLRLAIAEVSNVNLVTRVA